MIRSSKLNIKFANKGKLQKYQTLINQYKEVVDDFIDQLWNNLNHTFESPKMISTKHYQKYNLSQRIIKCAATQACSIIRSCTEKIRKLIWVKNKLIKENKDTTFIEKKIQNTKISKPTIKNTNCEINSVCYDIKQYKNFWFLQIKCIGDKQKIRIPIKPHRQTLKWANKGKLLNSVLLTPNNIQLRFEIENQLKEQGKTVGLDEGINNTITLSDGQISKNDVHGWNLNKIIQKLSRKKKGSKGFRKAQEHRKNYINWSINQLNLKHIKQVNVEKLHNVRKYKIAILRRTKGFC